MSTKPPIAKPREDPELGVGIDGGTERKAVALKYDGQRDAAPKVVAKGKGYVAENILAAAQSNAVPIYRNKSLVNLLMALDLDREIPAELYTTVAELLAYVYRLDRKHAPAPR